MATVKNSVSQELGEREGGPQGTALFRHHAEALRASAITPEVRDRRGYYSETVKAQLRKHGFTATQIQGVSQTSPALVSPTWTVDGEPGIYQIKADNPRHDAKTLKVIKYESARRSMNLDVHPFARAAIGDPSKPLFITEGIKKADSLVSQGLCTIGLLGVYNWRGKNDEGGLTALPDWQDVALNGRTCYIVYDSDIITKPAVRKATHDLKAYLLRKKAARVLVVRLPAGEGGAKTGVDDYLAAGHSVDELLSLASEDLPPLPYAATDGAGLNGSHSVNGSATTVDLLPTDGLTDLGDGLRLNSRVKGRFRWIESRKQWVKYIDGRFITSMEREIFSEAMAVSNDLLAQASQLPPEATSQKAALADHAKYMQSAKKINAVVDIARTLLAVSPDKFDAERDVLNLKNGTLNLATRELDPHSPDRLLTKRTDYEYQPGAECPRWLAFLDRILEGDAERIAFMRRIFGASLLAELGFDRLFVFYGTGANGKSVTLTLLREMLGDYSKEASAATLTANKDDPQGFQMYKLRAARLVTAVETGSGRRLNEELIKAATGGEAITAAPKYGHGETFKPVWKWILATNHKPVIYGQDEGIWRRICFVSFNVTIPVSERVKFPVFTARLREELPGILNWALDGLDEYLRDGLGEPESVLKDNEAYRADQDVLGEWLEARCVLGTGHRAVSADLFTDYSAFSVQAGDEPIGKKRFQRSLDERGCISIRGTGGVRYRTGICLIGACSHSDIAVQTSLEGGQSDVTLPPFSVQSDVSDLKPRNLGPTRRAGVKVPENDVTDVTNVTNATNVTPGCECPSAITTRINGQLQCTSCKAVWND